MAAPVSGMLDVPEGKDYSFPKEARHSVSWLCTQALRCIQPPPPVLTALALPLATVPTPGGEGAGLLGRDRRVQDAAQADGGPARVRTALLPLALAPVTALTPIQTAPHAHRYIFYDGPPFATGLPHYGHILAGTIKARARGADNNTPQRRSADARPRLCVSHTCPGCGDPLRQRDGAPRVPAIRVGLPRAACGV